VTGAQTLAIASQDGTVKDLYTVPGNPDRAATDADLLFGWAPDSALLAVYPGATATEISIIDTDGKPVRALNLPSGTMVSMKYWSWYGSLAWSPDSNWLVAAVTGGSMSGCIPGAGGDEPCYILLATNGSGAKGTSTAISAYFAWASDSRFAITHWYSKTVEIGRPGGSTPVVISLPGTTIRPDPLVAVNDGHVLAWSPDGTLLLVGGFDKNTYRDTLVVIAPDGTARTVPLDDPFTGLPDPETNFGTEIDDVAWTDDGQRLLFQSARTGSATRGIWSVDVSGGPATLLAETTGPIFDIADGRPW
jgi:WD40 repeat protein